MLTACERAIGEQRDALQPELRRVVAGFGEDTGAERERGHSDGESAIAALDGGEIGVTAGHG